jgi:phosphoribosylaminoimidazolecarboxamide formyltransferase/IMP cyclohydrolase
VSALEMPSATVVKHGTPCGVASAPELASAYRAARDADAESAFGGVVALNRECDEPTTALLLETFLEAVVSPRFSAEARSMLAAKSRVRLLELAHRAPDPPWLPRAVAGGFLVQSADLPAADPTPGWRSVGRRAPTQAESEAMRFAWTVARFVHSNAVVLAKTGQDGACASVGIGPGQTSRVEAVRVAVRRAQASAGAAGAVLASDGFFPQPDGVEAAAAAGVTAVVQPGGSKRDADVIVASDRLGLAMVITGVRHFRH